ncbi:uncharacterized protein LOC115926544 [Strongylocentrotus purpuratus]|uniref:Uncharacterized protein n=1 Tax=Strongylocentrotus purpuratus TaxID=7668 RepID=A0A7M7P8Y4_STRPU|nr:uncharacterized protein LOC115926544 [Strongylocentrotus purpuratus]
MATTMKLVISLCVVAISCFAVSDAFLMSVNEHLIKSCSGFAEKKRGEGYRCNSEVIDHVHDYAEQFDIAGYDGDLVENYLDMANGGGMCYLEGAALRVVKGECAAMELACNDVEPKVIDFCSKLKKAQAAATTATPTTTDTPTEAPEKPEVEVPTVGGRAHAFQ